MQRVKGDNHGRKLVERPGLELRALLDGQHNLQPQRDSKSDERPINDERELKLWMVNHVEVCNSLFSPAYLTDI